jgi:hypothetical protein
MSYCPHCGAAVGTEYRFCSRCGKPCASGGWPVAATPVASAPDHGRHVRILAILLLIWGGLGLLVALGTFFLMGRVSALLAQIDVHGMPVHEMHTLMTVVAWGFLIAAGVTVTAGAGLLDYKPWARWLALAVCILSLLHFPFGTALGIYGLWVLLSIPGEQHYRLEGARRGW